MAFSECDFIAVARVTTEQNARRKNQHSPFYVESKCWLAGFTGENAFQRAKDWARGESELGGSIKVYGFKPGKGELVRKALRLPYACPGGLGRPSTNPDLAAV